MVGDLVTHDLHDVVAVGDQTNGDRRRDNSDLPDRHRCLALGGFAGRPGAVDNCPRRDGVSDIVGSYLLLARVQIQGREIARTMSEGSSARSEDLDEGVRMLDLVGVLGSVLVHPRHARALRSTRNTSLRNVDVVVSTVKQTDDDHCWHTLCDDLHVLELVDLTGAHWVVVEQSHGPA